VEEKQTPIALRDVIAQTQTNSVGSVNRQFDIFDNFGFRWLDFLGGYRNSRRILKRLQNDILHFVN